MSDTDIKDLPAGWDSIPEDLRAHAEWLKYIKDRDVEDASFDWNGDIPPQLTFFRGETVVAFGHADAVDRDRGLQMAALGIAAFDADRIWFTVDAHMTDQSFYERYGRGPDPHELQQLCDTEGACDIGLTTDCLWFMEVRKDHVHRGFSLPYHVDRRLEHLEIPDKGKAKKAIRKDPRIGKEGDRYVRAVKKTHWMDDKIHTFLPSEDRQLALTGRVMDALYHYFDSPTFAEKMVEMNVNADDFGLTDREARLHLDIAGAKIMATQGFLLALATDTDSDAAVIKESMARSGLLKGAVISGDDIEWVEPDPDHSAAAVIADLSALALRERLKQEAADARVADEAEAARRKALRVNGAPSAEDIERDGAALHGKRVKS